MKIDTLLLASIFNYEPLSMIPNLAYEIEHECFKKVVAESGHYYRNHEKCVVIFVVLSHGNKSGYDE